MVGRNPSSELFKCLNRPLVLAVRASTAAKNNNEKTHPMIFPVLTHLVREISAAEGQLTERQERVSAASRRGKV